MLAALNTLPLVQWQSANIGYHMTGAMPTQHEWKALWGGYVFALAADSCVQDICLVAMCPYATAVDPAHGPAGNTNVLVVHVGCIQLSEAV